MPDVELSILVCDWDCDRNTILCPGMNTVRRGVWYGSIQTYFSCNLFFTPVNIFWILTVSPALKQALWEKRKKRKKNRSYSPCLYDAGIFSSSPLSVGSPLVSSLPLLFWIYTDYPASPIAINTINKYPDDSQICISSPDLQTHIQLPTQHLYLNV